MSATFIVSMIALSIALLIVLTVKIKLHPFFALTISAFFFGITAGHSIPEINNSIFKWIGWDNFRNRSCYSDWNSYGITFRA